MSTYKIYKIIADADDGTDRFLCYIGSTKQLLFERLSGHYTSYRQYSAGSRRCCTSYRVISKSHHEICLIEDLGDVSKKEAERIEGKAIQEYMKNNDYVVVNRIIVGRARSEVDRAYYLKNRDAIRNYRSVKTACPCGGTYTNCMRTQHMKTKQHVQFAATKIL